MSNESNFEAEQKEKYRSLVLGRWFDVIAYAAISYALLWVLSTLKPIKALLSYIGALDGVVYGSLTLLLLGSLVLLGINLGLFRKRHLDTWIAHPPLLFSVCLFAFGSLIAFAAQGFVLAAVIFVYLFLISMFAFYESWCDLRNKPLLKTTEKLSSDDLTEYSLDINTWTNERVREWFEQESPTEKLLFGYEKYVKEIYQNLIYQPVPEKVSATSLALVGELGSGKSSIIKTLQQLMEMKAPHYLVTKVDAWERDASKLDEQILELMLDTLADYLDVSGYRRLPQQYHNALDKKGGWFSVINQLVVGSADTKKRLQKLDDLLLITGKHILVVIEDPDRGEEVLKDKRMSRVFALIDRIKQANCQRIKVIVCCGVEAVNGDYRAIEYKTLIRTPAGEFANIINAMMDVWFCPEDDELVLPNGKPRFDSRLFIEGTPRDFKHTLREVHSLWGGTNNPRQLRGEMDFQQLVLLTFLFERNFAGEHSKVFQYIEQKLDTYKTNAQIKDEEVFNSGIHNYYGWDGKKTFNKPDNQKTDDRKHLDTHLENLLAEMSQKEKRWCKLLDSKLVQPSLDEKLEQSRLNYSKLQLLNSSDRINYYERFLNRHGSLICYGLDVDPTRLKSKEQLRDQEYLQAMKALVNTALSKEQSQDENLEKLLYAGGLSRYFYDELSNKLNNVGADIKASVWGYHAEALIDKLEGFTYTPNAMGNPIGQHLFETLMKLKELGETDKIRKLLLRALDKNSSAGLEPLAREYYIRDRRLILESLDDKNDCWLFYRTAILNKTFTPENMLGSSQDKDFSWHFLKNIMWGYEKGGYDSALNCSNLLLIAARQYKADSDKNKTLNDEAIERLKDVLAAIPLPTMSSRREDYADEDDIRCALAREGYVPFIENLQNLLSIQLNQSHD